MNGPWEDYATGVGETPETGPWDDFTPTPSTTPAGEDGPWSGFKSLPPGQVAPQNEARRRIEETIKQRGMFPSLTDALTTAKEKRITRDKEGRWQTPALTSRREDEGFVESVVQGVTGTALSAMGRFGAQSPVLSEDLDRIQQETGLSDEQMQAAWDDLGNTYRAFGEDEKFRVNSDGTLVPNAEVSDWLDTDKAKALIESSGASPESKARTLAALPQIQATIASEKAAGYEAAASALKSAEIPARVALAVPVSPPKSPSEWAEEKGRTDIGTPQFVRDYEKDVIESASWVKRKTWGLTGKGVLSGNKVATTLLGITGLAGSDTAGEMAAAGSEAAQQINRGLPSTGLLGAAVEESASIGLQIVTGRLFGLAGAAVGTAGTFATAGAQSAGMTYADELAQGTPEAEAREKAAKAGVTTAVITAAFGTGKTGGVERAAAGNMAQGTLRNLFETARQEGVRNLMRSPGLRDLAKDVLVAAGAEGAEEGIDQLLQAFITADPDTNLADAWSGAVEAAKTGAFIGGTVDVAQRVATDLAATALPDAPLAAAEAMKDPDETTPETTGLPLEPTPDVGVLPDTAQRELPEPVAPAVEAAAAEEVEPGAGTAVPAPPVEDVGEPVAPAAAEGTVAGSDVADDTIPAGQRLPVDGSAESVTPPTDETTPLPLSIPSSNAEFDQAGFSAAPQWDQSNRTRRREEWFDGAHVNEAARAGFSEASANGGNNLQAHGMAKAGTLSGAVTDLLTMLRDGLNPDRRGGRLDSAPLTTSQNAGAGLGTASGTSYRDGPFILVARPGQTLQGNLAGLGAILVNEAHPEIAGRLRELVQQIRPDLLVDTYANAGTVAAELNRSQGQPVAPPPTEAPSIDDYLAKDDLLSGARYAAEQAKLKAQRTGTTQYLVSRVDGFHIVETAGDDRVLAVAEAPVPVADAGAVGGVTPEPNISEDDGDVPNAQVAFFGDDESHIRFAKDSRGRIRLLGIYADPGGKVRGREMVKWLREKFPGTPVLVDEVAPDAWGFWDKMQQEGLVNSASEKAFSGKTVPLEVPQGQTAPAQGQPETPQPAPPVQDKTSAPQPYSPAALKDTFDLSDEQSVAVDALVQAMGLDTSRIQLKRGGTPGAGAMAQETDARDAEYLAAVERGDMETAQRMVDEATSGPEWHAAKHGTPSKEQFTEFGNRGALTGARSAEKAFFFSDSEGITDTYRMQGRGEPDEEAVNDWIDGLTKDQVLLLLPSRWQLPLDSDFMVEYAKDALKRDALEYVNEPGEDIYYGIDQLVAKARSRGVSFPSSLDPKNVGATYKVKLRISNPFYFTEEEYQGKGMNGIIDDAIAGGHDGVISRDRITDAFVGLDNKNPVTGVIYAVFSPNQIKSADPVTRDADGNVIPLSRRFNPESPSILYQFAGESANVPQFMRDSLETAKAMAAAGKSSEEIRAVTGWFPGKYDGKMRWEIPDEGASLRLADFRKARSEGMTPQDIARDFFAQKQRAEQDDATEKAFNLEGLELLKFSREFEAGKRAENVGLNTFFLNEQNRERGRVPLAYLLDHTALFEAYPDLKWMPVSFSANDIGTDPTVLGAYNPNFEGIALNPLVAYDDPIGALSTLLHETQHAIQGREGFAKGSSASQFAGPNLQRLVSMERLTSDYRKAAELADRVGPLTTESVQALGDSDQAIAMRAYDDLADRWLSAEELRTKADEIASEMQTVDFDGSESYRRTAGEIEARDVEARRTMTPEQRRVTTPYSSENIAPEAAVVLFQNRQGETASPFYSRLSSAIESADFGTSKAKPPSQWAGVIRKWAEGRSTAGGALWNKGISKEELKWSGIMTWLESQKRPLTKTEVLDHLRNEGAVRFEEVRSQPDESMGAQDFRPHVLPGGENYREVVLAMPAPEIPKGMGRAALLNARREANIYTSTHFPNIPNYVAHMRTNERVDADGKRGLFIEEIQSDRHQEGRKKGYREDLPALPNGYVLKSEADANGVQGFSVFDATGAEVDWLPTRQEAERYAWAHFNGEEGDNIVPAQGTVPDAPFRKDWPLQMFKRALRDAVASGKDWIGWTTGDTQNDRFDLSKQVRAVEWTGYERRGSTKLVTIRPIDGNSIELPVTADGRVVDGVGTQFDGKRLDEVVGKDLADKILAETSGYLSGDGLKVGGSGMKGFYDNMLPKEIGKYVKQWGGKVEKSNLPGDKNRSVNTILAEDFGYRGIGAARNAPEEIKEKAREMQRTGLGTPIWRIEITPEMRASVERGQPLFQQRQDAKGSFEIIPSTGDILLRGLSAPDVSTGVHEIAHAARRMLLNRSIPAEARRGITDEDIAVAEEWAGAKNGIWNVDAEEKFARGMERYLRDGKAPVKKLQEVFDKIGAWLREIYANVTGSPIDVEISDAMRAVFDKLVSRNVAAVSPEAKFSPETNTDETEQLVALDKQIEQDLEPEIPAPDFTAPPLPPEQSPTSLKHAQVDADRAKFGLPPRFRRPRYTDQAAWDRAIAAEDAWSRTNEAGTAGSALLDRLIREGPRALTKDEHALLLHEKLMREDAVEKSQAALNRAGADGRKDFQDRVKAALDRFNQLADYADAAGSASGLSLQARKMLVNRDYSLASVAREMHAAKNLNAKEPVPWTAADQAKAAEVAKKLQETQARLDTLLEENTELTAAVERLTRDVEQAQAKLGKQVRETRVRKLVKEKLDPLVAEARARLEARGKVRPSQPPPPPGEPLMQMPDPRDAEYLAAVERGDMETAQRMVDEAAKAAGLVYLGLPNAYFEKRTHALGDLSLMEEADRRSPSEMRSLEASIRERGFVSDGESPIIVFPNAEGTYDVENGNHRVTIAKNTLKLSDATPVPTLSFVGFADPVTRDADGNVIPLSQRFNPESPSILYSGLPPETVQDIKDMATVCAGWLVDKALTVSEFGAKLVSTFGDWVKDHIDAVFSQSQSLFTETAASVSGGNAPTPEQVRDSLDPEEELTKQDVWELARAHVIAGARGRNVLENVFNDLSPLFPDLTRDRVAELFTDYGKTTRPSQNETAKELQRVKSLERIALKLADVRAKQMPKRTGFQRGEQDAEIRELEKQFREEYRALEEEMRAKGIPFEDSERRLKTALGAVKRRMLNEIEEIERAIASGQERNAAVRQPVQYDQEAIDLRARLEAKRAEYDAMFSRETTREKRVAAAIKSLDRQIAEEEKMLADGILKKAKGETVTTPEIETRREQLRQMRQNRRDLYAAQNPDKIEAEALAAAKRSAQRSIERLGAAVASGDVAVKRKDPAYTPDAELLAMIEARETLSDMVAEMRRALPVTPEKEAAREKRMLAAAEKTLEDLDAKLAAGDLSVKAPRGAAVVPASVQAVRAKIKAANRQLDARRREAGVGPYSMDAKIQRQLGNVNKRLAEYQRRIREKDFTRKTAAKPVTSPEILDAEFEAAKAKAEYQEMLNRFKLRNATFGQKAGYYLFSTNNLLKLLTLGFDIGVLTRQLGTTYQSVVRDLGMFAPTAEGARLRANGSYVARTIRAGVQAFMDPKKELEIYKAVSTRPNAGWDKSAGLVFGAPFDDQAGTREDVPTANFIETIPWWVWPAIAGAKVALVGVSPPVAVLLIGTSLVQKRLLIALDRAQRAMTNQSRALWFDHALENLPEAMQTAESAKVLGTAIMVGTGRGVLPKKMEGIVPAANMILLATRFYVSRIQSILYGFRTAADVGTGFLATPKATKAARQEVAKMYARSVTGRALLLMLAAMAFGKSLGGDDEEDDQGVVLDPFNPDFGRIKLAEKTKLDFMSGINGFMGVMARVAFERRTDPETGRKDVLSPSDMGREVTNFFASKRNLQVSYFWNLHKGEFYGGKPANFANALEEATTAIIVNDTVTAFKELGPVKGAALTMLMLTGAGTAVGDTDAEEAQRKADKAAAALDRKRREAELNR